MRLNRLMLHLLTATALTAPAAAQELPTVPTVVAGIVDISTTPGVMTMTQPTDTAIVNWNSFSIGTGGLVTINQPNANSVILNRVTGDTITSIAGRLTSTGQVFIINPNGIAITSTGVVNTAGFTASTLGISDENFLSGTYTFEGDGSSAMVSNAGQIEVMSGGYAALLGGRVDNSGSIIAPLGKVGLGAAELITLDFTGDGFLQVAVPSEVSGDDPLISNSGSIDADGGYVQISVAAAKDAARNVINLSGSVEARSFSGTSGAIVLSGDGGLVTVSGTLNTSTTSAPPPPREVTIVPIPAPRPNFRGGYITITGDAIRLADADLDASGYKGGGDIRVGGDFHGNGLIPTATTLDVDFLTSIKADALLDGDGGTIVLWSDDTTAFAGRISAQGAGDEGVGGSVEVSGKEHLNFTGSVDTRAESGKWGSLLLDPRNIVIVFDPLAPPIAGDESYDRIGTATIESALTTNAVVTIDTSIGLDEGEPGNIRVRDNVAWTTNATLRLFASNDIDLIPGGGDLDGDTAGNIVLNAGRDILGFRSVYGNTLTATAVRNIYFNLIDMSGLSTINAGGNVYFNFNVESDGGLRVDALGEIETDFSNTGVTSANGDIVFNAGGFMRLGGPSIATPNGSFTATASNMNILSDITGEAISLISRGNVELFVDDPVSPTRIANLEAGTIYVEAPGTFTIQQQTTLETILGDLVVNTGRFVNQSGANALMAAGRYIVYSNDWDLDFRNEVAGINLYNRTMLTSPPGSIPAGTNAFVYARQPVLTFTIDDAMRVYFDALTTVPSVSYTGLVNGDLIDYATDGSFTDIRDNTPIDADVGSYLGVLRPFSLTSPVGYAINYVGGNLSVTPAPLTVIASSFGKVYGDVYNFTGTEFTTVGLRGTDVAGTVMLVSTGASGAATVAGGPYAILASNAAGGDFGNYTVTYTPGSLTVTPRTLTVSALDFFKIFRTDFPFTGTEFTTAGLVNADRVDVATLTSTGQPTDALVGIHPILISGATGSGLENYTIGYAPGTMVVGLPPTNPTIQPNYPPAGDTPTIVGLTDPFADALPGVLGPEMSPSDARVTLQNVERISQQFAAAIAECERQLEENGDSGAYLTCTGDALEAYADALDNPLIKLPPELKATITVIRQTAQRVRAAATSPNPQAAVREARAAVGELVDFVRQQTALVRAVDPETQALLQQQGQVMTQALQELDLQLVGAVEI